MEAQIIQSGECIDWVADGTYSHGDVIQVPDGRAGIVQSNCVSGDTVSVEVTEGLIVEVPKTASMVVLVGSQLFWDYSANKAHLLHRNDRDFYLGCAQEDKAAAATVVKVALNKQPVYTVALEHGFASLPISTAGWPRLGGAGKGVNLMFDLTAEAQKLDALSLRGAAPAAIQIVDCLVCINTAGDAASADFSFGLANGTHATDADAITESLLVHIDGGSTNIALESDDGTTEVAATDSTVDFTAGTPFLVQWDLRDLADIQVYIDGVNVLPSSVFKLDAATGPLKALAHIEKDANDTPGNVSVLLLGARTAQ